MDAIADITAVCMLMNEIKPDRVIASPVHVGSGQVRCAHGILPVPAPATAYILKGVPIYGGAINGELCTPTGAALLRHFVGEFGDMPVMSVEAVGYGMGKKDFERANAVRVMLGSAKEFTDSVIALSCNVDDMTAEEIAFASEELFKAGAREVFTTPAGMKKSRPGTLITVICTKDRRESILKTLFSSTSTIGVRESVMRRYILDRSEKTVHTPLGDVRKKVSSGYGVTRYKYEYEDLAAIAREKGLTIFAVRELVKESDK